MQAYTINTMKYKVFMKYHKKHTFFVRALFELVYNCERW